MSKPKPIGRPSKLTPEVQERIVKAVREGNYAAVAARSAGIGETTFYRWMQQGEEQEAGEYREFWEAIKTAEAEAEVHAVGVIRGHMILSWQAAMTYLERKFPDRWKRRDELDIRKLSNEQLVDLYRAFASGSRETGPVATGNGHSPD